MRSGGIRFSLEGNGYWLLVYVMNVGGGGNIGGMWVKGSRTWWISMTHNWGVSYQAFASLAAQPLSFKITSYSTTQTVIAWNVVPPNWAPQISYSTDLNFHWTPISKLSMLFFVFIFSFQVIALCCIRIFHNCTRFSLPKIFLLFFNYLLVYTQQNHHVSPVTIMEVLLRVLLSEQGIHSRSIQYGFGAPVFEGMGKLGISCGYWCNCTRYKVFFGVLKV